MKYLEILNEANEEVKERYELVKARVEEIAADASSAKEASEYFETLAKHLTLLYSIAKEQQKVKVEAKKRGK